MTESNTQSDRGQVSTPWPAGFLTFLLVGGLLTLALSSVGQLDRFAIIAGFAGLLFAYAMSEARKALGEVLDNDQ